MSDEPKKRWSRAPIGWALIAVFVLYPLSYGPAFYHWTGPQGAAMNDVYLTLYKPLFWCGDHSETFNRVLIQYLQLWDWYR